VDEGLILLIVGGVLAASIVVAFGASRAGVPSLVVFLGLGMLLGSEGPGGIAFDDADLARKVGVVALAAILFEGGLATSWRRLREVAVPAALLATVGVVVTAVLAGLAAYALFDLTWLESVLLGAVVSSTDAAAVFATLRFTHIRRRLARTLEAETGGADALLDARAGAARLGRAARSGADRARHDRALLWNHQRRRSKSMRAARSSSLTSTSPRITRSREPQSASSVCREARSWP
jgi:hypothetical protein